ncbi:hypothetical protein, partial [Thiolapillus sp.]|uniref:hypothetical protein n=1 Tax=Thiolapillus sp. TaxID=2017437 RepID=UPI003AF4D65C
QDKRVGYAKKQPGLLPEMQQRVSGHDGLGPDGQQAIGEFRQMGWAGPACQRVEQNRFHTQIPHQLWGERVVTDYNTRVRQTAYMGAVLEPEFMDFAGESVAHSEFSVILTIPGNNKRAGIGGVGYKDGKIND